VQAQDPDFERRVRDSFAKQGLEASTMSPSELGAYIKSEITKWSKVLRDAGGTL